MTCEVCSRVTCDVCSRVTCDVCSRVTDSLPYVACMCVDVYVHIRTYDMQTTRKVLAHPRTHAHIHMKPFA
jgi:hypothetical protein